MEDQAVQGEVAQEQSMADRQMTGHVLARDESQRKGRAEAVFVVIQMMVFALVFVLEFMAAAGSAVVAIVVIPVVARRIDERRRRRG